MCLVLEWSWYHIEVLCVQGRTGMQERQEVHSKAKAVFAWMCWSHSDGTPNPKILVAGPESVVRREEQAEHGRRCTYLGKADVSPYGRRPNHTGFAWRRASRAQRLPHNSASFSTQSDPKLGCEKQGCLGTAIYPRVTYASPLPGPSQSPPSWEHPKLSEVEVVTVSNARDR